MDFKEYYKKQEVVGSYNKLRLKGLKGRVFRRLELVFVDYLTKEKKKQKILEIGVGTGFISRILVEKGDFYGMDISEAMLKTAKQEVSGKYKKMFLGDILDLKVREKFDKVVSIRVISHFNKEDVVLALKNVRGILNNGGEFIFNLENRSAIRRFLRRITRWGSTYTYQFKKKEIDEISREAGLEVEEILCLDHFFVLPLHVLNKIFMNKLENFIVKLELRLRNVSFMCNNFFIKCKR